MFFSRDFSTMNDFTTSHDNNNDDVQHEQLLFEPVRVELFDTNLPVAVVSQQPDHPCQESAEQRICRDIACIHNALLLLGPWVDVVNGNNLPLENPLLFGRKHVASQAAFSLASFDGNNSVHCNDNTK